jgi:hypothetical protein
LADDSVRIEIAFAGGPVIAATVAAATADALERAVGDGKGGAHVLDTDDGRLSVALDRIAYIKRFARDARVGFGL